MNRYHCPKCGRFLERTPYDGLWCAHGCYKSEYELWEAMQPNSKSRQIRVASQLDAKKFIKWAKEKGRIA